MESDGAKKVDLTFEGRCGFLFDGIGARDLDWKHQSAARDLERILRNEEGGLQHGYSQILGNLDDFFFLIFSRFFSFVGEKRCKGMEKS